MNTKNELLIFAVGLVLAAMIFSAGYIAGHDDGCHEMAQFCLKKLEGLL